MEMIQIMIEAGADVNGCPAVKYLPWLSSDSEQQEPEDDEQEEDDTYSKVIASVDFIDEIEDSYASVTSIPLQESAKVDINAPPSPIEGRTALQAAIETGNISLVRFLIKAGADIHADAASDGGSTCLQAAAEAGSLELVDLLRSGANVKAGSSRYGDKASALQAAIQNGKHTVVSRLISCGARIEESPAALGSLINTAIRNGETELAEQFFAKASPAIRLCYIGAFSNSSVRTSNLRLMRIFIEAGVDTDKPVEGDFPIETAARNLLPIYMKTLLEAGANVKGVIGARAVAVAVWFDYSKLTMLHALLSAGASPKKLPGCKSPLRLATERWSIKEDVVNLLLHHGADANEESGMPLELAAANGCIPAVDVLLEAGADVNAPALHARQNTALQSAERTLRTYFVEKLIGAGADINPLPGPEWGMTALQGAVDSGSLAMVRLLLSRGADVNGPPSAAYGATAPQKAVIKGNLVITSLLLKHGADVNAPPAKSNGRTALEAAAEHGRLDIMHLLLRNDEEPDTFNLRCRRAVKLAEAAGHLVLARVLGEWRISHSTHRDSCSNVYCHCDLTYA